MPEGPEIRIAADRLHDVLAGRIIERAEFTSPELQAAASRITGQQVERVTSHGKAMLTEFGHGETLYSHNQLYGVWHVTRRGQTPRTNRQLRVGLHTAHHSALLYSATDIELWPTACIADHPFLKKLGPDVLDRSLSFQAVTRRLLEQRFHRKSLGTLYLNQAFIAGIGTYLRSEILFQAKVPPNARPCELGRHALQRLARATLTISRRSYRTRGITVTKTMAKKLAMQGSGFESYRFAVFGRKAEPCIQCATPIQRLEVASRRLYWCPTCQAE